MSKKQFVLYGAIAAFTLSGCTAIEHPLTSWPQMRPLGVDVPAYKVPQGPQSLSRDIEMPATEPQGKITLRQALAAALRQNPKLASASFEVRIAEAKTLQAGLLPNPEAGIEIEEFAGSGNRDGFKESQTTLQLSQLIEMGGKRLARVQVSNLQGSLAAWDYETQRIAIFVQTTLAFIDVLTAQEQLRLAEESHTLSTQIYGTVAKRVKIGKVAPLEKTKAAIERANAKITLENAKRHLAAARKQLASVWAGSSPQFEVAVGEMDAVGNLPAFEHIEQLVKQNPDVARWAMEMEHRLAVLALERARRVPNLTVSVGLQQFQADNDTAFAVGVSMPLPFYDRNQGGILAARYGIAKARQDRKAAEVRTLRAVGESYEFLAAARSEAITLKNEVLPAAQEAFDAARQGYKQGKFGYLEVLDAQRTFFETRARYTVVLASYHRGVAVL